MKKRFLSVFLSILMILSVFPAAVLAEEEDVVEPSDEDSTAAEAEQPAEQAEPADAPETAEDPASQEELPPEPADVPAAAPEPEQPQEEPVASEPEPAEAPAQAEDPETEFSETPEPVEEPVPAAEEEPVPASTGTEEPENTEQQELGEEPASIETEGSEPVIDEPIPEPVEEPETPAETEEPEPEEPELTLTLSRLSDTRIVDGGAEFTVKAVCSREDVTIRYQWQQLDVKGSFAEITDPTERALAREAAWKDMRNGTSAKLTFRDIEDYSAYENLLFRCRVTARDVVAYADEVKLLPEEKLEEHAQSEEPGAEEPAQPEVSEEPQEEETGVEPGAELKTDEPAQPEAADEAQEKEPADEPEEKPESLTEELASEPEVGSEPEAAEEPEEEEPVSEEEGTKAGELPERPRSLTRARTRSAASGTYSLVTAALQLSAGDEIILLSDDGANFYTMGNDFSGVQVTLSDLSSVTAPGGTEALTLAQTEGGWLFIHRFRLPDRQRQCFDCNSRG